ncbi:MAG: nitroreductase [Saccharofermentans sp.]|nr:nitroreductase [Saccharofermentans sp.]
MNETIKVLETRRSCRNFDSSKMVNEETVNAILEAGTYAASGMGKQSAVIIAVTNKEVRDQLSKENASVMGVNSDPFYGAPVILIVLANKDVPTYMYDGSLVMGNLMNAAKSLGVDSIWIHRAKEEFESDFGKKMLADLGIEGNYEGIGHCALGYAASELGAPAARKDNYVYYVK